MRFIFGIYGNKARRQSLTPYLKELHFLPVRYRIKYKVALLVFKCLNNIAPKYLATLLTLRNPNEHCLRIDNDFYLLKVPPSPQFKRTEGAFCFYAPKTWNELPYSVRCINKIEIFKKRLKSNYFSLAFECESG